jgi:hypothetical protein
VELVTGTNCGWCLLVEQGHDPVHQGQLLLLPLGFWQRSKGRFADLAQITSQALGGFGGVEWFEVVTAWRLGSEGLMNGFAEGMVVKACR